MASSREPEGRSARSDDAPADERGPYGQLARLFLTQLLAVIAIAAVITAVVAATGGGLDDDVTATPDRTGSPAVSSSPAGTPTPAPAGSGDASSPAATTSATTSAPATTAGTTEAERTPKVDVLNQSAGDGAASQAADRLRAAGWRIGRVDDFRGNVSTTTVYWLTPDMRRDARRVARDLGGVRVQQGFSTLVDGRISVILVD
jgi:hypothetical protein